MLCKRRGRRFQCVSVHALLLLSRDSRSQKNLKRRSLLALFFRFKLIIYLADNFCHGRNEKNKNQCKQNQNQLNQFVSKLFTQKITK